MVKMFFSWAVTFLLHIPKIVGVTSKYKTIVVIIVVVVVVAQLSPSPIPS